jgi:hypothetical protein
MWDGAHSKDQTVQCSKCVLLFSTDSFHACLPSATACIDAFAGMKATIAIAAVHIARKYSELWE